MMLKNEFGAVITLGGILMLVMVSFVYSVTWNCGWAIFLIALAMFSVIVGLLLGGTALRGHYALFLSITLPLMLPALCYFFRVAISGQVWDMAIGAYLLAVSAGALCSIRVLH